MQPAQTTTPPMPIPEIRTENDLAMFNQFMIQLGREAASSSTPNSSNVPMIHVPSFGGSAGSVGSPSSAQSPVEDLFNPEELASLGLTGLTPVNGVGPSPDASGSVHNNNVSFNHLYPPLDNMHHARSRGASLSDASEPKRAIAGLPRNNSMTSAKPNYPNLSDLGAYTHFGMDLHGHGGHSHGNGVGSSNGMGESSLNFDSLARSKFAPPPATLAPRDFHKKTYRHVASLGAAVSSRSHESSMRTSDEPERSESPEEVDEEEAHDNRISVRNLLLADEDADPSLKLPRLHRVVSNDTTDVSLPGVAALARSPSPPHYVPTKRHTEDELSRGVKRLELEERRGSGEDRPRSSRSAAGGAGAGSRDAGRRHAVMIRAWLVAVNLEWRRRRLEAINSSGHLSDVHEDDERTVIMGQSDGEDDEVDELEYEDEEGSATPEPVRLPAYAVA